MKIWCVEDDAGIRDIEVYTLRTTGFEAEGFADGERIVLTLKEFELLRLFLSHPGIAFTRDRLFSDIWGDSYIGQSRTVDMHIRTLRQKLGRYGEGIETVRGVGYRWEVPK